MNDCVHAHTDAMLDGLTSDPVVFQVGTDWDALLSGGPTPGARA